MFDYFWVPFRHGFPMILSLISDTFPASILGALFYSILLNLGSKMEPKWVPKSLKEHPKSRLYPQGSILAVFGSFWYHFGTPKAPFSEPLVHFAIILVPFWCAFRAPLVFLLNFRHQYFGCLPLKINSICVHSIRKMISATRRMFCVFT